MYVYIYIVTILSFLLSHEEDALQASKRCEFIIVYSF